MGLGFKENLEWVMKIEEKIITSLFAIIKRVPKVSCETSLLLLKFSPNLVYKFHIPGGSLKGKMNGQGEAFKPPPCAHVQYQDFNSKLLVKSGGQDANIAFNAKHQSTREMSLVETILQFHNDCWYNAGMHNIRPAGQLWPAKALNLAREDQKLVELACLFHKSIL